MVITEVGPVSGPVPASRVRRMLKLCVLGLIGLIGLGSAVCFWSCKQEDGGDPPRNTKPALGGFDALIDALSQLEFKDRSRILGFVAESVIVDWPRDEVHTLVGLVMALVRAEEFEVAQSLFEKFHGAQDSRRIRAMVYGLRMSFEVEQARNVMRRWALIDTAELRLAPFRSGGAQELIRAIRSIDVPPEDRFWAAVALRDVGDGSMIAELSSMIDDKTSEPDSYRLPGEPVLTLGQAVRDTISELRRR